MQIKKVTELNFSAVTFCSVRFRTANEIRSLADAYFIRSCTKIRALPLISPQPSPRCRTDVTYVKNAVTNKYSHATPNAEIHSEKCVVRRSHRCANVIECPYTNLDSIAYYTPGLYGVVYCF